MARAWRRRGPVASAGPARLLVVDDDGPVVIEGRRSTDGGVVVDGVLYPDELLRDLGADVYQLATALKVPADGDTTHRGEYVPLVCVGQLDLVAEWTSFDRARRRINYAALWDRGGEMGALVRNFILACVLFVSLFTGWAAFRAGSAAGDAAREAADLRAALYKVVGPAGTAVPVTPTLGPPQGDRRTPTPAKP